MDGEDKREEAEHEGGDVSRSGTTQCHLPKSILSRISNCQIKGFSSCEVPSSIKE